MKSPVVRAENPAHAGAPAVWIHGFLGTDAQWYAVRALDTGEGPDLLVTLPGHGDPVAWFPAKGSFEGAVETIAGALPEDRRAVLVGYSMGARVALAVALAHPEKCAGALLLGVHPGFEDEHERRKRARWDGEQAEVVSSQGLARFLVEWEALPVFAPERLLDERTREARRAMRASHTPHGAAWALRTLGTGSMPPMGSRLHTLRVPVRLLTGSLDNVFTNFAHSLALRHPARVTHRVLEGVGHDPALFSPAEVAAEVRALRSGAAPPEAP